MTGLTASLARFLANLDYGQIPADALPLVRDAFTDTVGVIMVGVPEPVVGIVLRTLIERGARPQSRACLSRIRCSAPDAALLGGTAAHALDYDDQSLSGHPSAVLVPAILAEAEALGASGRDLVSAYVAGYEVWAELLRRDSNYHMKGWHPTSVYGVVATAAAASVLRRLPVERASAALAIAASHAGGLAANFGTMTKPYHAGLAARSGLVAARLAAAGMTAKDDALENPQGFLHAFSPARADLISPARVGAEWYLLRQRLCIKKYPTCYFMHRSFDAAVKLLAGRKVTPADVAEIEVTMGRGQTAVLVNERPKTGLEAKFSEQFAMAAAVVLGRMGVNEVSDQTVQRPDIQAFFPKVRLMPVDEYDTRDPAHSPTERVVIRLTNGETLDSGPIKTIAGHADEPLSSAELWEKFAACTAHTHTRAQARALFDALQAVEELQSVAALPTCESIFAQDAT
ncbi:MAG: MmgE/PrpD family protein [Betaproteobacteria bacterium]|nr:MAG: MmgE/PrpD family protein [Betaproteobacteria bacterium]